MSIHFAAARRATHSPVARALARRAACLAANDNGEKSAFGRDSLLRAALEQFGEHGLGAARHAYARAEQALADKDLETYVRWHAICRALDRPLAARLEARLRRHDACA